MRVLAAQLTQLRAVHGLIHLCAGRVCVLVVSAMAARSAGVGAGRNLNLATADPLVRRAGSR
jgi:hypothetical protein